ncbi:MAG TPA: hypothetical protein VNA04_12890 [Thermoanaerobaculia bacterium]|nr:hypothetical protein [Thermoanaerobaculia bacterium]
MKRLAFVLMFAVMASAALAFDPSVAPGDRIAVLGTAGYHDVPVPAPVASLLRGYLVRELRGEEFDAFDTRLTHADLLRGEREDADYYVEIVTGYGTDDPYGGVAVAGRHAAVEIGVVVSRVIAEMRIYDGRTLELIDQVDVQAHDTGVVPTAVGIGGRHGIWVGLPVMRAMRHRAAAREAARNAAQSIAGILEAEARRP